MPEPEDIARESAVRRYLAYLQDPAGLRDDTALTDLRRRIDTASDPLDKLRAISALERAEALQGPALESEFVRSARAWAEAEGVTASAFRQLGVSDDVLRQAGFDRPGRGPRRSPAGGASRTRAPGVPIPVVKQAVRQLHGVFTLADAATAAGGSPATVRKAVEELVSAGEVERLGPAADHKGPGRAPTRYARR